MRKLLSLATLLFLAAALNAQNWCPPGATWLFNTGSPWSTANTLVEYVGDTTIDGYAAQRFDQFMRITQDFGSQTTINTQGPEFFTRNNGDVVWEYNGTSWDTLYWFSAVPGDQWSAIDQLSTGTCPTAKWVVVDTFTTNVYGIPLRALDLIGMDDDWQWGQATIIERIGGEGQAIFPAQTLCGGIVECFCNSICYSDQDINPDNSCQLTLNMDDEVVSSEGIKLFPQPANSDVQISSATGKPLIQLLVTDARGKMVLNETINNAEYYTLSVEQLPAGYYVLRAKDVMGAVSAIPLVIAR